MKLMIPDSVIDDGLLVSSTIIDNLSAASEWLPGTTYTAGQSVQYRHTHYTAIVPDDYTNLGQTPGPNSEYWTEGDASNKWAMFDSYVSTQTVGDIDTDIVVVLSASKADTLCLMGCENVLSVNVQLNYLTTGETVLDQDVSMVRYVTDSVSSSWWDYFYGETEYRAQVFLEFTAWTNAQITLTITPVAGYAAKIGHCVFGQVKEIGTAQWGVAPTFTDYSTVTRNDASGKISYTQGNYVKSLSIPLWIYNRSLDYVSRALAAARSIPAVWNANENDTTWESIITFGFVRDFTVTVPAATYSTCTLTIEGLV